MIARYPHLHDQHFDPGQFEGGPSDVPQHLQRYRRTRGLPGPPPHPLSGRSIDTHTTDALDPRLEAAFANLCERAGPDYLPDRDVIGVHLDLYMLTIVDQTFMLRASCWKPSRRMCVTVCNGNSCFGLRASVSTKSNSCSAFLCSKTVKGTGLYYRVVQTICSSSDWFIVVILT